jgi:methionyl-tRNA formyltransferase
MLWIGELNRGSIMQKVCGMKILFLTNNEISLSLYNWLKDKGENVILYEEKINHLYIEQNNIDFIISYNYKTIIRPELIKLLPHKIINLHISYLPYNRGAYPNIWSFIENTPCGVTIHEIDDGIDTGNILVQEEIKYDFKVETLASSYQKSNEKMQSLFIENWDNIKNNKIKPKNQIGNGTFHLYKDFEPYKDLVDYSDTIEIFLKKVKK